MLTSSRFLNLPDFDYAVLFHIFSVVVFVVIVFAVVVVVRQLTSGTFSPCLKKPVAMGYVETAHAKNGTDVMLKIRNKMVPSAVTAMPFLETSYYKP